MLVNWRAMEETALSRQLQQAWLETQIRKQMGDLSSHSSFSSSHGVLSPFSQQHTPSSSSSSWDPGSESPVSVPPMQPQSCDEETFHDPALQYINKMLMDEDLEDRKCMMAECMSYFTTVKGFYEILGSDEVPSFPCLKESDHLRVSGQAVEDGIAKDELFVQNGSDLTDAPQDYSLLNDDGSLGDFAHEGGQFWFSEQNDEKIRVDWPPHVKEPLNSFPKDEYPVSYKGEVALNEDGKESQWIDDLFLNVNDVALDQHPSTGVVQYPPQVSSSTYPGHSDTSGTNNFVSQHSFDSSSHIGSYEQNPLVKLDSPPPSSVLAGSSSLHVSWSKPEVLHAGNGIGRPNSILAANGYGEHNSILGAHETNSRWSAHGTSKFFVRSASDSKTSLPSSKTSMITSNNRFKRAASEIGASVAFDSISVNSLSAGSNGEDLDSMEEERISFVRNKDLNAEKYATILNEGLGAMKKVSCAKPSAASTRGNVSKPTIVVATVADLKGLLTSCAQAVASNNIRRANEILQEIRQDATPYGSGLQRLAHHFAEGLVARLSGTGERLYSVFTNNSPSAAKMLKSHHAFVEVSPFVKISHYFANRAIVEAAKGASRLHIIDYGILYGIQWPCLISALAERKGGPPVLRITGIDFPQPGVLHAERVELTGKRLAEYAKTYGVPFEYHAIASRWETIQPSSLNLKQDEVVIVNCMNRLHHLLDETVLASNPRKTVLSKIHEINPKIFVHGILNGNYNAPFFMSRFKEALASFLGGFDLLETVMKSDSQERMMIEREILGRNILNVLACEGPERVERPETYRQWQNRTLRAGFDPIPLHGDVLRESQAIVKCHYNKNFTVDEDGCWLLLSWKGKVFHGLSLWKPNKGAKSSRNAWN